MTATAENETLFAELRAPLDDAEELLEADSCLECGGAHAPAPRVDMTAIAVAHGVPYLAQAAGCDWLDRSRRAECAAAELSTADTAGGR